MADPKKTLVEKLVKQGERVLVCSLGSDGKLFCRGDHQSMDHLNLDPDCKNRLTKILRETDTSVKPFKLNYSESSTAPEIPIPPMRIKECDKANCDKLLSQYFASMGFGLNGKKNYGDVDHKPEWYGQLERENAQAIKWSNFRNPSRLSKVQSIMTIEYILKLYYGLDPEKFFLGGTFPANLVNEDELPGGSNENQNDTRAEENNVAEEEEVGDGEDDGIESDEINEEDEYEFNALMESIDEESNRDLDLRLQDSDDEDVDRPFRNNGIVSDSSEEENTTAIENRKRKKTNVVTVLKKEEWRTMRISSTKLFVIVTTKCDNLLLC